LRWSWRAHNDVESQVTSIATPWYGNPKRTGPSWGGVRFAGKAIGSSLEAKSEEVANTVPHLGGVYTTGYFLTKCPPGAGLSVRRHCEFILGEKVSSGDVAMASVGKEDAFMVRWEENSKVSWYVRIGSKGEDRGTAVVVNEAGVYMTGFVTGAASIQVNGKNIGVSLGKEGTTSAFVLAFEPLTGKILWHKAFTPPNGGIARARAATLAPIYKVEKTQSVLRAAKPIPFMLKTKDAEDPKYHIHNSQITMGHWLVITGAFSPRLDFEGGFSLKSKLHAASGQPAMDAFVLYLGEGGKVYAALNLGGESGTGNEAGMAIEADGTGVYVGGYYTGEVVFGEKATLPGKGALDGFLLKLPRLFEGINPNTDANPNINANANANADSNPIPITVTATLIIIMRYISKVPA